MFLVGCFLLKKVFQKKVEDIGVLIFEWVLIFQNFIVMVSMDTYIRRVLVFDGYLYSRVYGITTWEDQRKTYRF